MTPVRPLALAAVVALTFAALPATADPSVTSAAAVDGAAAWLADHLVDGDHLEGEFGPQYGPTADVAYALAAAGSHPDALADVLAYLTAEAAVGAYVHGQPFDGETTEDPAYVGATAKLGLLVTVTGMDPRDVAGDDLVATLQSLEQASGRFRDRSDFGDFANLYGQAFGVAFLEAAADVDPTTASVQALLAAQCDDGGFPEVWDETTCTSQVDVTGLVVQALALVGDRVPEAATAAGDAAAWLQQGQGDDGSWGDPPNVNSTGYAGMGLLTLDQPVAGAQAFLAAVQGDDGGLPVSPGGDGDPLATAQALPLLASSSFAVLVDGPGVPTPDGVERVAGGTRIGTAIAVSRELYPGGDAGAVVLARADDFADALAGAPVAVAADAPLLLTPTAGIPEDVLAEIQRVLPQGTVHLLGGTDALAPRIADQLEAAGYAVARLGGETRYDTAVEIATFLGDPDLLTITTGHTFPDALGASVVAALQGGAVLLSDGSAPHPATSAYLGTRTDATVVAVGGPAAAAHPSATAVVGEDRDATAVALAERYVPDPGYVAVARNDLFADALAGAVQAARIGAPLVLTRPTAVPAVTAGHLCAVGSGVFGATVYGGVEAVDAPTFATLEARLSGADCPGAT